MNTPYFDKNSIFPMLKEGAFLSARIFGVLLASVNPAVISYPILLEILSSIDGVETNNNDQLTHQQEAFRQSMLHLMQKTADRDRQIAEIMKLNGYLLPQMVKDDELQKLLSKPGNYAAKKLVDGESVNPGFVKIITDTGIYEMPPGVAGMLCEKDSPPGLNTAFSNGNLLVYPEEQKLIFPTRIKTNNKKNWEDSTIGSLFTAFRREFFPSLSEKFINYTVELRVNNKAKSLLIPDLFNKYIPKNLSRKQLHTLLSSPCIQDFEELKFRFIEIDEDSIRVLLSSQFFKVSEIESLVFHHCKISGKTFAELAQQDSLKKIDCNNNIIDDSGINSFLNSKSISSLEELSLSSNKLTKKSIIALLKCQNLKSLKKLNLSEHSLSSEDIIDICKVYQSENFALENLDHLNLKPWSIDPDTKQKAKSVFKDVIFKKIHLII